MKTVDIVKRFVLPFFFITLIIFGIPGQSNADITPVSDRTPAVRDAIVATLADVNNPADVTVIHPRQSHHLTFVIEASPHFNPATFQG